MADGGHVSAQMVLVELDLSAGKVSAGMALAELDLSAGKVSAGMALAEMDLSAGQISAEMALVEMDNSTGQISAEMALVEMDNSTGQISAEMALVEMDNSTGQISAEMALAELEAPKIGIVASEMALAEMDDSKALFSTGMVLVELDADFFGRIPALMALVELEVVPDVPKLSELNNKIGLIVDGIETTEANLRALIEAGTAVDTDYRSLQASLTGYRDDIAVCRDTLDALDVITGVLYDDASEFIGAWNWERGLRTVLIGLDGKLREVLELLDELINGFAGALYVVRAGDTLQSVAAKTLGSFNDWRQLAEANDLTPGPLTPGAILTIPERK